MPGRPAGYLPRPAPRSRRSAQRVRALPGPQRLLTARCQQRSITLQSRRNARLVSNRIRTKKRSSS
ncbi:hypothetical protein BURMUCF2_0422 [Burkholderia multivorans CF2]|nr:hypothetical protein BURMUCF2_0422 [Burkholderia multivorans CF2]